MTHCFLKEKAIRLAQSRDGGPDDGEQVANALGDSDTRRFVDFVIRAWNENWPTPRLDKTECPLGTQTPLFRDFALAKDLAKASKKIALFAKPSGFHRWS